MPLTETQAEVLAALARWFPARLSVAQVCAITGLAPSTVRAALRTGTYDALTASTHYRPARWWITNRGRLLARSRLYREFLTHDATTTTGGQP
ncbi:MarR family transcriptional regulator [Nocardia sp. CNY236]|uniref:MarR family transcriptional regulator n=1 Tax=Nocardia sp. CNY236 TaxID=1169152 RepID=UPI00040CB479|nr:MarR family transcriptional regulator [Nocardia sp. CNY236]